MFSQIINRFCSSLEIKISQDDSQDGTSLFRNIDLPFSAYLVMLKLSLMQYLAILLLFRIFFSIVQLRNAHPLRMCVIYVLDSGEEPHIAHLPIPFSEFGFTSEQVLCSKSQLYGDPVTQSHFQPSCTCCASFATRCSSR